SLLQTVIVLFLIIAIIVIAIMYYQMCMTDSVGDEVQSEETDEIVKREEDSNDKEVAEKVEEEPNNNEEAEENDEDKEEDEEEEKDVEFKVVETDTGSSPKSTLEFNEDGEEVIVELETTSDTYLDVKDDNDEVYFSGTFTSGTSDNEFDLSGQERIYFNIGNASGVSIKINGTELEFPVDPTEKVHQKLWIDLK